MTADRRPTLYRCDCQAAPDRSQSRIGQTHWGSRRIGAPALFGARYQRLAGAPPGCSRAVGRSHAQERAAPDPPVDDSPGILHQQGHGGGFAGHPCERRQKTGFSCCLNISFLPKHIGGGQADRQEANIHIQLSVNCQSVVVGQAVKQHARISTHEELGVHAGAPRPQRCSPALLI